MVKDRRSKAELLERIQELEDAAGPFVLRGAVVEALGVLEGEVGVVVEPDKRSAVLLLSGLIDAESSREACDVCGESAGLENTLVNALRELRLAMKELRPVGSGGGEGWGDVLRLLGAPE